MASTSETFEKLARAGFAARGVTYGMIGVLAFLAAVGSGGSTTGSSGALEKLAGSTLGATVLILVAIGLFGYAVWRLVAAALDLENQGTDKEGLAHRIAHSGSGLFHGALAIFAVSLVIGASSGGSGGAAEWTARLMAAPFGRILVGIGGIIGFVVAAAQVKKAMKEEYKARLRLPTGRDVLDHAIKAGIVSRAAVFAIIGGFLLFAAISANPENARGIGGALSWLQSQAYGGILLAVVAVGLVLFAFYSFLQARYRFIPDPETSSSSGADGTSTATSS